MKNRRLSVLLALNVRLSISLIFIISLIISCSGEKESSIAHNQINVADAVGSGSILKLSDYASDIQYIPLETNEKSILGNIRDIAYEGGKIYVLDNNNVIKIFENSGKYLSTIDRSGRGPQEYNRISSFKPAAQDKGVYVLDNSGDLFLYDHDGLFIEKRSFPKKEGMRFSSFVFIDSCILTATHSMGVGMNAISVGNVDYDVFLFNNSLDTIAVKSFSQAGGIKTTMSGGQIASIEIFIKYIYLSEYGNQTSFLSHNLDTIFTVNKEGIFKDAYLLNYGKYRSSDQEPDASKPEAERESIEINPPFFETDKYLYLTFNFGANAPEKHEYETKGMNENFAPRTDVNVNAIFDKKSGKLMLLNRPAPDKRGFVEDIKGGLPFWPSYMSSKGELIAYSNALNLINAVESDSNSSSFIKELSAKLKEDDNPVVAVVKQK